MSTTTLARRLQALESTRPRYCGIVVVLQGETVEQALARVQPAGPYVVVPAKKEPHHARHP